MSKTKTEKPKEKPPVLLKRQWVASVRKWRAVHEALRDNDLHGAEEAIGDYCGYCDAFLRFDGDGADDEREAYLANTCRGICPLTKGNLCEWGSKNTKFRKLVDLLETAFITNSINERARLTPGFHERDNEPPRPTPKEWQRAISYAKDILDGIMADGKARGLQMRVYPSRAKGAKK